MMYRKCHEEATSDFRDKEIRIPCECGKVYIGETGRNLPTTTWPQRWFWELIHCQALSHQGPPNRLAGSPTHTHQLMAHHTHQGGHRNLQARHCSTGHRFLHQWYLATPTTDLHPKSTTLPPHVLVNWFSSVSTHSSPPTQRIPVTLILQHPFSAWSSSSLLKQQHLPESGILRMTIRAYRLKRRVVTSSSFQN